VKVVAEGKWRARPRKPAAIAPIDDGVFGLGGLLFGAESRPVRAQLTITEAPASSRLLWDVCYRLATASDEVNVGLSDGQSATLKLAPGAAPGELRHMQLTGTGDSTLSVVPSGAAELCGAVIEADPRVRPGVVLDTLGINGARLATPLAWDEARWTQELARRAPVLAVIEYGTNEAGDIAVDPRLFAHNLKALLGRVRRVNEDVDCLVLAPTDRKDTAERTPLVRNALRDAARTEGCGFWDTYEAMGGRGSIVTWHGEKPPRASRDGVHLTARGYRELGNKLAEDLLQRYRP
jgi:lysophospholipase L1-like esterase